MITTTDFEKQEIHRHIRAIEAKSILEIGAFKGETTRLMADAIGADGRVVVVDPMRWSSELLRNGIARHLPSLSPRLLSVLETQLGWVSYETAFWDRVGGRERANVMLFRGLSTDHAIVSSPAEPLASFDLAFIDGDHGYRGVTHDIECWGSRVREGGVVLVHDATPRFPGVVRALGEWADRAHVDVAWPTRDSLCAVHIREDAGRARQPMASVAPFGPSVPELIA